MSEPQITPTRSDKFISFYSNNIRYELGIWDLKLILGEVVKYGEPPEAGVIEEHAHVTLSWLQAKVLAIFLSANVSVHEDTQGPINVPATVFLNPELRLAGSSRIEDVVPEAVRQVRKNGGR